MIKYYNIGKNDGNSTTQKKEAEIKLFAAEN
jgi:hypothetical protein